MRALPCRLHRPLRLAACAALAVLPLAACSSTPPEQRPTEVVLKNGQVLTGDVRAVHDGIVEFVDSTGEELPLARIHIRAIEGSGPFADPPLLWRAVPPDSRSATPPASFVRMSRAPDGSGSLDVAVGAYEQPVSGRRVYLVGAVHVAHKEFFQQVQSILDSMDLVLWEGVGAREKPSAEAMARFDVLFKAQVLLKNILNLDFQLDEMDYRRPFWRNSDLSINDLQAALDSRGLSIMPNEELFRAVFGTLFKVIDPGAIPRHETLGRGYRALIAPLMADPEKMMLQAGAIGLKEVLIDMRNAAVIADLANVIAAPGPERIAIFYGAGHLPGMDRALRDDLGLRFVGLLWIPAWRF